MYAHLTGHVITGDFKIIKDRNIRDIFSKGPNYRLPTNVDFNKCSEEIQQSIDKFSSQWCKQEDADLNALNNWKKLIFSLMYERIKFYQSNSNLVPSNSNFSISDLKKALIPFHDKYVFVPADKASNNIIII